MRDLVLLLGRLLISGIFLWDSWLMVTGWDATRAYMENFGVPGILLPAAAGFQFAGGVALVVGWRTGLFALAFAGYSLLTAALFHGNFDDPGQLLHLGKNSAIAGGFLFLYVAGAGRYSLDGRCHQAR